MISSAGARCAVALALALGAQAAAAVSWWSYLATYPRGPGAVRERTVLDELHVHVLWQAADVVVRLDGRGRSPVRRHRFDDVGVQGALSQEAGPAEALRLGSKDLATRAVEKEQ